MEILSVEFLAALFAIVAIDLVLAGDNAIGEWPEAAVVIFLFALAELIETLSLERARNAIRGLMAMAPEIAMVRTVQWTSSACVCTPNSSRTACGIRPPA